MSTNDIAPAAASNKAPASGSTAPSSVWSRGPPAGSSNPPSGQASGVATPASASSPQLNGQGGNAPVNASGAQSRKGAMMVGSGVDIKKGPIAFGTVDSPNHLLSSSPAAPTMTGTHLADTVKSFGSLAADSPDPESVKIPSRRTSTLASPDPSNVADDKKKTSDAQPQFPKSSGQPNGQPFMPVPNMRPQPNMPQNRSPQLVNQAMPPFNPQGGSQVQHGFRPPQPGMMPQMQPGMQRMMRAPPQYAIPGQQYPMMYPQQGQFYGYPDQQYGMKHQWVPPQHPQNQSNYGMSPRPNSSQPLPSPGTTAPSSAGPSPGPTPAIRPPASTSQGAPPAPGQLPSTPMRPSALQPGATFTPGSQPSFTPGRPTLNAGSSSFTPVASKAIKFARPDGTSVNIKDVAAAAKGTSATASPAPEAAPEPAPEPKKKVPSLPVIVRIESEDQKKARLQEEAQKERIRKLEEEEERERKERKERQAKEEEEKKAREAKEAEERAAKEAAEAEEKRKQEAAAAEAAKKAEEERKNAEEEQKRKAEETPEPSAAPTPAESPAAGSAALPPKPAGHRPPALDLQASSAKAGPSALHTAKPIEDLKSIVYPGNYHAPSPALNADSPAGQYRYDTEFLLQFMTLCREKPEGFPALADIGMSPDSSGAGGAGRGGRGGRGGMGPPGRGGAGMGAGGMGRPGMGQGMGSFNMGNFGSGSIRGTTSEERIQMSNARAAMGRTPSQGGPSGLPPMHGMPMMTTTRSGNRSGRGTRRPAQAPAFNDPNVVPLAVSSNSWVKARPTDTDEKSPAYIERKVKALLNKLTEEKFESISNQILEWANKSRDETDGMTLKLVIKQIFEKATDEAHWSSMYAKLCRKLLDRLDPAVTEEIDGKPTSGGTLFRKYLVGRCQMDFEAGWKAREDAASAAKAKSDEDKAKQEQHDKDRADGKETEEVAMLSDEYYAAQKAKRRGLGLVQLIGELYKLDMINNRVIKSCLKKLMINITDPDEEDLESTCRLITTVGEQLEARAPEDIDIVWTRLDLILALDTLPSRIRFMIMDVKDLRRNGWVSRNKQAGVMTIAEIHQQAAREQAEKAAAAQRESISRGGSRAGHARRDGPQPGEWQSVATNARPLQRPADFSNLGRNFSSAGLSSAPNFGPASVFQNKRKNQAGGATPPLSRQASTANMFGVLSGDGGDAAATSSEEAAPQRKKLELKPRTKPIKGEGEDAEEGEVEDGDEEEDAEEEEDDEEEAPAAASAAMTETAAKAKIDTDMKELWGEKDAGGSRNVDDVVEYFKSLPEERQSLLSERLADDVFRIAKLRDAELVARSWTSALEQGVVSKSNLQKGIEIHMPTLDDDAIDFPQAYKAIALLMRSLSLSEDEIKTLLEKVDVYGSPRITPTDKLNKAFAQLDEEAKA